MDKIECNNIFSCIDDKIECNNIFSCIDTKFV